MLKYLLDTNIIIYVMKRRPLAVLGVVNANARRMTMSAITLSELHHGAEKSARVNQNLLAIEEISSLLEVLAQKRRSTTGRFAQHWKKRANRSACMTCTLPPTPEAKGWRW